MGVGLNPFLTMTETMLFLTENELRDLTGYRQASKQVAHLKAQRIPFHVNRAGHPRVARAILEGKKPTKESTPASTWSPSWAADQRAT